MKKYRMSEFVIFGSRLFLTSSTKGDDVTAVLLEHEDKGMTRSPLREFAKRLERTGLEGARSTEDIRFCAFHFPTRNGLHDFTF